MLNSLGGHYDNCALHIATRLTGPCAKKLRAHPAGLEPGRAPARAGFSARGAGGGGVSIRKKVAHRPKELNRAKIPPESSSAKPSLRPLGASDDPAGLGVRPPRAASVFIEATPREAAWDSICKLFREERGKIPPERIAQNRLRGCDPTF